MKKRLLCIVCVLALIPGLLSGCGGKTGPAKLGISFGVGPAARWPMERGYMEERAKELGVDVEVRFNTDEAAKTQLSDCRELIDSGIDVLILVPRDANNVSDILAYAKEKKVQVVDYARVITNEYVDLFVGYDSTRIGQSMGKYLAEQVDTGDYIILRGDSADNNATLLYEGAMQAMDSIKGDINILLDEAVPNWDPAAAKQMVMEAVAANGNHVDAILAPNDKLAGACVQALEELGVSGHVSITGMDAELDAVKRIVAGTQDITFYMDLRELSRTAVEQAVRMAEGKKPDVNAEYDNGNATPIPSSLITGKIVTDKNIDKILIESGYFTKEEVYG